MRRPTRRQFLGQLGSLSLLLSVGCASTSASTSSTTRRPNILFAIADDWSWPHASIYGAKGISTPNFDRVAREGCLFNNTFTAAPQCSPNRAATLTGRNIWQIEEAGTHGSIFPNKFTVYTDLLEQAGYFVGYTGKPWAPGNWREGGWKRNPVGREFSGGGRVRPPARGMSNKNYAACFEDFLEKRNPAEPFFFWYGAHEPHRAYEKGSGVKAGKSLDEVTVPKFLPDTPEIRSDILDYFLEIEWFDTHLGKMLKKLEAIGELDNTIVLVSSDNGMPFPRAKANLYEYGTHVPMAISWPGKIQGGRTLDALTSFIDFGPTFLEAAGVSVPRAMTGRSFLKMLTENTPAPRDHVVTGRERHSHSRFDNWGYPARAIRTPDYLYIHNLKPDRWPAGDPKRYYDIDDGPSKGYLFENGDKHPELFEMSFGKRPHEELFDIRQDPECMNNLAQSPAHQHIKQTLAEELTAVLKAQKDPRVLGTGDIFESYPRFGRMRPELGGFAEQTKYNPKYQPK